MQWKYGDYSFEANNVFGSMREEPLESDSGLQIGYKKIVELMGRMSGSQSALTTEKNNLLAALRENGSDLIFLEDDGTTQAIALTSSDSLGGVQVRMRGLPELRDAQWASYLDFNMTFEAEYLTNSLNYHTFWDSLTIVGNGGPRRVVLEGAFTTTEQITRQQTRVTGTQTGEGSLIGGGIPFPAPPLFPGLLQNPEQAVTVRVGRERGKIVHTTRWNYQYLSTTGISGVPILR